MRKAGLSNAAENADTGRLCGHLSIVRVLLNCVFVGLLRQTVINADREDVFLERFAKFEVLFS